MSTSMTSKPRRRNRTRSFLFHATAIIVVAIFVVPLWWGVVASLRQPGLPPPRTIEWLPRPAVWGNYARIFEMLPLARYTLNSLFVAAVAVPLTLVVASWAGFAMAQQRERTRKRLMIFSLVILLIPLTTLWLTRFILFKWLGLINTPFALIVPALAGSSPLFVLLFYWTFRRIPKDLFESARLDGAGALIVWRRIALPMAVPTTVAVGVLAFLFYWSDFINPLMYLRSQEFYTLPVGLQQLQQLDKTNWPLLMAGAVLMAGPAVVMFLFVQRYFLRDNRMIGSDGR